MHIIILEGDSRKGKTPTLQMVYAVLKTLNATITNFAVLANTSDNDFEVELTYQNKTVAIYSKGDNQTDCYNAITNYANKNVDVFILAHSSIHSALTINPPLTLKVISKTVAQTPVDKMLTNLGDCRTILIHI
jgi:hypothetical protein